jgi:glycosyltransferase involved in cell wall biosynthesis
MSTPLISIILPTFDRLAYLRQAVDSVFAQTLCDWELIVADDGSDGVTLSYLQSLTAQSRVRVIRLPHCGIPARVRNVALQAATGKLVAFIDSDDLWEPEKLEVQVATLEPHGWGYTAYTCVDESGQTVTGDYQRLWNPYAGDIFAALVTSSASVSTPSVIALRQLVLDAGGFDEAIRVAEDHDLWMRLALRATAAVVDRPLVRVRRHEQNSPAEWSALYVGREISLQKLQSLAPTGKHLIRDERALNAIRHALHQASRIGCFAGVQTLIRSAGISWRKFAWWRAFPRIWWLCLLRQLHADGLGR